MALDASPFQMERHMKDSTRMIRNMDTEYLVGSAHQPRDAMKDGGPKANKKDTA
jgi:hypothetical protein